MIPFLRPCRAAAPRMTRGRSPVPGPCGRRAAAGSRSRGRPAQGVAHPLCGDGPRSRGRPVHGRVGRASVPWLPAPAQTSPAALPVRPCAGAVLRPPHFHHSIWKANDKPAPPNVMISLRFPAAGAERGAPEAACSTAFALRGRGFRRTESSAGQPRLLRPARTRFSRRPAERFCAASPPAQKAGRSRPATCSPIPAGAAACAFLGGCGRPRRAGGRARFVSTLCW